MPNNAHDGPGDHSNNEAALSARLRRLGDELGRERPKGSPRAEAPNTGSMGSGLARGLRLSTELVAGVLVGAFVGWALDRWLGISPWGLIVFLLLGFAAGVRNVVRAVNPGDGSNSGRDGDLPAAPRGQRKGCLPSWPTRSTSSRSRPCCRSAGPAAAIWTSPIRASTWCSRSASPPR